MEFDDRDIRQDPAYIQELMALDSRGTPTTVIEDDEGERHVIIGFRQQELGRLLGVG